MFKTLVFFITLFPFCCFAQVTVSDSLLKIAAAADSSIKNHPAEKLYLQFDKLYYAAGDIIWFKAYLFNAPTLGLSAKSGIMYLDISNDSATFTKQYRLPVKNGLSCGNISLTGFPAGNYTLHAYTNWMRNFGADCFFYKRFMVADDNGQTWLANSQTTSAIVNDKLQANIKLQLSDMDKTFMANKALQLQVMAGNHHLYKQQEQTDQKGILDVNFKVPDKATGLSLVVSDEQNGNKITIPINLNRAEHADLQFLPEGGNLVAGLSAHIGFKAIGEDGKGVDVSGIITDQNQKQAANLQSFHNGMGSFDLIIKTGEIYSAKVNLPGGVVKEYALPAIKSAGTVLRVINPADKDSVTVELSATSDIIQAGESYFLIGKARGIVCYAAVLNFKEGTVTRKIAKQLFPSGITHFILANTKGQPLNERLVFIDHRDNLHIELATDKQVYAPHDSIALHITVIDTTETPVAGNFSLAVTDDAQAKKDTLNSENIITRMLLTGDLKGFIEEPGYYLQIKNTQTWQALDNLLLTQGWVNYDWQADKSHLAFAAENEFEVKGQVQNGFNGSIKRTHVTLLSKSPLLAKDTLTDNDGRFVFRNFPEIDTPAFVIKAVNRRNKSFNVGIVMDHDKPPAFTMPAGPAIQPWYIGGDTALLNVVKNNRIRNEQAYLAPGGHMLKEVKITAQKIVKGSQNLNGPGNADLVLDEKDMEKAGKESWLQLFQEKIKGFREGSFHASIRKDLGMAFFLEDIDVQKVPDGLQPLIPGFNFPWYLIDGKPVKFIVDGISIGFINHNMTLLDITNFLESHNAEDIKGIEVNSSSKYTSKYIPAKFAFAVAPADVAFIEITTRSGHGPFLDSTPGIYLYKPLPLSWPKQFYKPKYVTSDTTKHLPDLRSTIDWEPNVITDKNGNATVSFYTADKPGTYTIIIEGTDGNGNLGYKVGKITISKQKPGTK